jgi:hypothetical protein
LVLLMALSISCKSGEETTSNEGIF